MEIKPRNRIAWLDSSRGIAFLMVVYSHLEFCNHGLMKFFSPIFLTTFFFVSGYLFKSGASFSKVLEQRTRTLFIPFLIYGTLLLLTRQLFSFHEGVPPFSETFTSMICQSGQESRFIWFIPALFVYSLLFYWIDRFSLDRPKRLLALSMLLFVLNSILLYLTDIPDLPYTLHLAGFGCAYMGFGKVYKHYEAKLDDYLHIRYVLPLAFMYVALAYTLPGISFIGSKYMIDSLVTTLAGLLICVYISKSRYFNNKLLLFVGSNSLLYFCLHGKVYSLLESLCHKFVPLTLLHNSLFCDAMGIVITFADVLILVIPIMLINRYAPFTTGKGYKLWK